MAEMKSWMYWTAAVFLASGARVHAQTAKAAALFDPTGYWVSIVTEDWRWRMTTPPKGDYQGVPLNAAAKKIADAWDPEKDEAAGEQCRSYGAANIMRVPGRIHITWQDEQTLKFEMDAGTQTRVLSFSGARGQGGDWQGVSQATWELLPGGRGQPRAGSLKVVTSNMKSGYLRKNGVAYSASATVSEYYDLVKEANGDQYLVLTETVEDPTYLDRPYMTTAYFRKQADAGGWNPTPCSAR
ncbi:MAG TPA: hypothetical protein VLM42_15055 [Bryobacteraceae bacterium]|nr:hypothetical protein [Bryobacteraceae bacterium]